MNSLMSNLKKIYIVTLSFLRRFHLSELQKEAVDHFAADIALGDD